MDLNLNETEYGILSGTTYTIITAISGILMGFLADRFNRKYALIVISFLWSSLTLAQSFSFNFYSILIPRILVEICLSATFPLCFSLISDTFHPKFRARASAIYMLGLYLGVAMSSLSIIIVDWIGWRNTYRLIAGLCYLSCF